MQYRRPQGLCRVWQPFCQCFYDIQNTLVSQRLWGLDALVARSVSTGGHCTSYPYLVSSDVTTAQLDQAGSGT
jgi:hypothetical protein